jgi:hypothetical protein
MRELDRYGMAQEPGGENVDKSIEMKIAGSWRFEPQPSAVTAQLDIALHELSGTAGHRKYGVRRAGNSYFSQIVPAEMTSVPETKIGGRIGTTQGKYNAMRALLTTSGIFTSGCDGSRDPI